MHTQIVRSTSNEALRAELHREELMREAALTRLARSASSHDAAVRATHAGLMSRIRSALGAVGQPAQPDCPECA